MSLLSDAEDMVAFQLLSASVYAVRFKRRSATVLRPVWPVRWPCPPLDRVTSCGPSTAMCHMVEIECRLNLVLSTVGLRQLRVCSATILQQLIYVSCATSVVLSLAVCGCGDAVIRCGWLFRCYRPFCFLSVRVYTWAEMRAVVTHVDAG